MMTNRPTLLASLLALGLSAPALARDDNAPTLLDALIVTGTRTETSVRENPTAVAIVERDQIEKKGADSVAALLRDIPGVSVVDSAVAGMKRIRIRGEQSNRVVILVDGQELTDHSSFGSPLLVDPANIERIEVVRGPASVLHGAKAIGGVINIITRKGADKPVEFELGGSYHSATRGWQGQAAVSGSFDRFDYRLSASADEHKDRKVADGKYSPKGKLDNSAYENEDLSLHLGMKLGEGDRHYLALKANHHSLKADGWQDPFALVTLKNVDINPMISGQQANIDIAEAEIAQFNANLPKRDLDKIGLYYQGSDFGPLLRKVSADVFHQKVDRVFANAIRINGRGGQVHIPSMGPNGMTIPLRTSSIVMDSRSKDRTTTYGGSTQFDFQFHPEHYTLFGVQYLKDKLETSKLNNIAVVDANPMPPLPQYQPPFGVSSDAYDRATMETASAFALDEWTLGNDFKLHTGVRYYNIKSELDKTSSLNHQAGESSRHSRFVKALGLTWTGLPHTTLRAGYSEGYVMPSLLEQFTDSRAGRGITLHGNPDLTPERSRSYELGLRYQNRGVVFDGTLFYNRAKDFITFESCAISGRCSTGDIYINADRAKSYGLELLMEYWIADTAFTPYLTTTWMRRQLTVDDFSTWKTDVPRLAGRMGVRYEDMVANTEVWADLSLEAASSVDKKEREIEKSGKVSRHLSGWSTLNFAIGADFGFQNQYRVALHANNLFDRHYRAAVDEIPGMGRHAVLSFRSRF
ncbi:MAG: TonB-dependent receptor [Thauera sp.]|jgi:hemoglobin/transferrin/lactoferrin receptor protein|nr:TonB-dependent receptor [Thauera sp.]